MLQRIQDMEMQLFLNEDWRDDLSDMKEMQEQFNIYENLSKIWMTKIGYYYIDSFFYETYVGDKILLLGHVTHIPRRLKDTFMYVSAHSSLCHFCMIYTLTFRARKA